MKHHPPSSKALSQRDPLVIFDTHPIQYRSPVFRALAKAVPELEVYFFDDTFDGKKWWFHEFNKIPEQKFAVPLQEGYRNTTLRSRESSFLLFVHRLRTQFAEKRPGAVVLYGYYMPEHWALWWLCKRFQIPLIFIGETFQGGGTFLRRTLKQWLHPLFFRSVFRCIAIGNRTQAFYASLGVAPEHIIPAKYCVDNAFFRRSPEEASRTRSDLRKKMGVPENAFVLLFVGRLFERKRPHDFLSLHQTLQIDPDFYSWMIGNGPLEKDLVERSRAFSRFSLLGFKNQKEVRDYYCAADLLIVPSEYETWGLVVNEALASGLPAVVTDQCGVAGDLIVDGETGYVCPRGQIDAFARAVRAAKAQPELHAQMAARGTLKVEKEYSLQQFADALLKAYQAALLSGQK